MSDGFTAFDPAQMAQADAYHLLNAVVVPRPIGWVSTLSDRGVANIAPHSYFNVLSADPPTVFFSSSGVKDSLRNARHTGDFAVNIVGDELAGAMNFTSADFPPDESEFTAAGLHAVACDLIQAPRLLEAPASLECRVTQILEIGRGPSYVVIGEVVRFHVADRVLRNGRVDTTLFRPLGRLSGSDYVRFGEFLKMPRPTYAGLVESGAVRQEAKQV